MALHRLRDRKIQENTNDADTEVLGEPLGAWLTCRPRGRHHNMNRKRTSFILFDMVAELAIELAR
eukprot:4641153-Amphidinium_carterae.1